MNVLITEIPKCVRHMQMHLSIYWHQKSKKIILKSLHFHSESLDDYANLGITLQNFRDHYFYYLGSDACRTKNGFETHASIVV